MAPERLLTAQSRESARQDRRAKRNAATPAYKAHVDLAATHAALAEPQPADQSPESNGPEAWGHRLETDGLEPGCPQAFEEHVAHV